MTIRKEDFVDGVLQPHLIWEAVVFYFLGHDSPPAKRIETVMQGKIPCHPVLDLRFDLLPRPGIVRPEVTQRYLQDEPHPFAF